MSTSRSSVFFAAQAVFLLLSTAAGDGLTAGFVRVDLPEGNFVVQSPYDVPQEQRYRYDAGAGVRTLWVYANDKPFNTVTPTNPRTEVRLADHDYTSGVWQFEGGNGDEIHNEDDGAHAITFILHVYNGTLHYHSGQVIEACLYDSWFQLNVIHDVSPSTIAVYINGEPRLVLVVTPKEKDLESEEALWALYERWCKAFHQERDRDGMRHDYTSRMWQFEGYGDVPSRTSRLSVMQIHNENGEHMPPLLCYTSTTAPLHYYSGQVVEACIYDRWFRLNLIHDIGASMVAVYINGEPRLAMVVTPRPVRLAELG
uniref:Alginate lyase 2 domain-containing protein n=1 Tax=Leersia perrieri TaxID=77586 RepID=A0A0D9XX75_9ORYZ